MAIDKLPQYCSECKKSIVLTTNHVIYGRTMGKELVYYCPHCKSYAFTELNKENQQYEAIERMKNRHRRNLEKEVRTMLLNLFEQYCFAEDAMQEIKRICLNHIKRKMGYGTKPFNISTMNTNEVIKVKEIMSHYWGHEIEPTIASYRRYYMMKKLEQEQQQKKEEIAKEVRIHLLTNEDYKEIKEQADEIMKRRISERKKNNKKC